MGARIGRIGGVAGLAGAVLLATAAGASAQPVPTDVVVRAVAHDAKVVGSSVGGVRVTIREAETGRILAEGTQKGGTGDTELIMRRPHERGATVYGTSDAAAFRATLDLDGPTVVKVTAEGPLGPDHAIRSASRTLLLLPGRDVTGEGVVLELQGLVARLESPEAEASPAGGEVIPVRATVEMMCGCPVTPGGLWDADRMEVRARLTRDGRLVGETVLRYAGEPSTFEGELPVPPGKGTYELVVTAAQDDAANFGVARRAVTVPDAAR